MVACRRTTNCHARARPAHQPKARARRIRHGSTCGGGTRERARVARPRRPTARTRIGRPRGHASIPPQILGAKIDACPGVYPIQTLRIPCAYGNSTRATLSIAIASILMEQVAGVGDEVYEIEDRHQFRLVHSEISVCPGSPFSQKSMPVLMLKTMPVPVCASAGARHAAS
jgi:hypothetical protein